MGFVFLILIMDIFRVFDQLILLFRLRRRSAMSP